MQSLQCGECSSSSKSHPLRNPLATVWRLQVHHHKRHSGNYNCYSIARAFPQKKRDSENKQITDEAEKCIRYSVAIAVPFVKGFSGKCNRYSPLGEIERENKQRTEHRGRRGNTVTAMQRLQFPHQKGHAENCNRYSVAPAFPYSKRARERERERERETEDKQSTAEVGKCSRNSAAIPCGIQSLRCSDCGYTITSDTLGATIATV